MTRTLLTGVALADELADMDPEDFAAAVAWTPEHQRRQAAEFGYVRTPGHNSGCQCETCNENGARMAAPPNAAPAPQCADCTVDLVMANTSWLDPQLCRQCSETRRRAA